MRDQVGGRWRSILREMTGKWGTFQGQMQTRYKENSQKSTKMTSAKTPSNSGDVA